MRGWLIRRGQQSERLQCVRWIRAPGLSINSPTVLRAVYWALVAARKAASAILQSRQHCLPMLQDRLCLLW